MGYGGCAEDGSGDNKGCTTAGVDLKRMIVIMVQTAAKIKWAAAVNEK